MRPRFPSRNLFIVDLVTLLLLVLAVAMRVNEQPANGHPASEDKLLMNFTAEANGPSFRVALVGEDIDPIIGKPGEILDAQDEFTHIISTKNDIHLSVSNPENIIRKQLRVLVFAMDRGTQSNSTLKVVVEVEQRNTEGKYETRKLQQYDRSKSDDTQIAMIANGEVNFDTAIIEIRLAELVDVKVPKYNWYPVQD